MKKLMSGYSTLDRKRKRENSVQIISESSTLFPNYGQNEQS